MRFGRCWAAHNGSSATDKTGFAELHEALVRNRGAFDRRVNSGYQHIGITQQSNAAAYVAGAPLEGVQ